jgi:hypothetical protein
MYACIQGVSGVIVNIWEVIVSIILNKNVHIYMCPIVNGCGDTAV